MPAEWETHEAVWLAWPYDRDSFPNLEGAENAFSRFVAEVSEDERVELLVTDELMEGKAKRLLEQNAANLEAVNFHILKYADIWFRDYGPIFVVNREHKKLAMTKWIFNAWGNKYKELLPDNEIPYAMNKLLKMTSNCAAPVEDPEIAVAVVVEHGGGGRDKPGERPGDHGRENKPSRDQFAPAPPADKDRFTDGQGVAHNLGV